MKCENKMKLQKYLLKKIVVEKKTFLNYVNHISI